MSSHSVIIFPDDSSGPLLNAVNTASRSIRIKMFVFTNPALVEAVIAARARSVKVQLMLNPARRDGEDNNLGSRAQLVRAGIEVKDSNPAFGLTHEKSLVVDDETAFVGSLNWETENLTQTRDYAICTSRPHEVNEIVSCFEADWQRTAFQPDKQSHLVWCPINGRERIARLIDEARHTLFVQNQRFQDPVIIERLVRAKERGVKVHVLARPPHTLKEDKLIEGVGGLRIMDDIGIKVHKLKALKLHGMLLLADGLRAITGSINLAPGSFDDRRELAIETHDDDAVERMHRIFHHDWQTSHPLDLTDQGLMADLAERASDSAKKLVLDAREERGQK
jgi:phosphatidylserine/phosphatidylglycerophosphate/cardiolipin synthase-like enzyme